MKRVGVGPAMHSTVSLAHVSGCALAEKYWRLPPGKPPASAPPCAAR